MIQVPLLLQWDGPLGSQECDVQNAVRRVNVSMGLDMGQCSVHEAKTTTQPVNHLRLPVGVVGRSTLEFRLSLLRRTSLHQW